jgi:phage baseplate assembly protein V
MDRDILRHINHHLLRPIALRVANSIARGVVKLIDDSKQLQIVQLGVLEGETVDGGEHFQPYGISGVPPVGSEAVVVFPNGDRGHPLVFSVTHRASRPTGGQPGEFTIYNGLTGAKVRMLASGDIEITPATGKNVLVHDAGSSVALALKADVDALKSWASTHTHLVSGVTAGGASVTSASPLPTPLPTATGTTVLKAQ